MSHEPPLPEAAISPGPQTRGLRTARAKAPPATKAAKSKSAESLSRGALAGRIAAGAAIGSAAIAGALLFAGKIDGKTPKRVWDKVKSPARPSRRPAAKKPA